MARAMAARQVAVALDRAETALDQAVREVAALAAVLPEARGRAAISAVSGQKVFETTSEALMLLTQARGRLVDTHRRLDALRQALDLPPAGVGPVDKPEEDGPREPEGLRRLSA